MTDRLSRPPVKLKAAQPDGTLNGLGRAAKHFLSDDFKQTRFLVVEVGRTEKVHKDATGADVAVLENLKIAMPADQQTLGQMLSEALAADFEGTIPAFPVSDRGKYEAALEAWAERLDLTSAEVRKAWVDYFKDPDIFGPAGALMPQLVEFVVAVCGGLPDVDEPEPAAPLDEPLP